MNTKDAPSLRGVISHPDLFIALLAEGDGMIRTAAVIAVFSLRDQCLDIRIMEEVHIVLVDGIHNGNSLLLGTFEERLLGGPWPEVVVTRGQSFEGTVRYDYPGLERQPRI